MSSPYSQIYNQIKEHREEDERTRFRLSRLVPDFDGPANNLGEIIEAELGIPVFSHGPYGKYVKWENVLRSCDRADLFDIIYHVANYAERNRKDAEFLRDVRRIFDERRLAFTVDENGTVHPRVDPIFNEQRADLIKGLSNSRFEAARTHTESALDNLAASKLDYRNAIRQTFDAVENIYKVMFPKVTNLNAQTIKSHLAGRVSSVYESGSTEALSSDKTVRSLKEWVDGVHFYRHADGQTEPRIPPDELAIVIISQGFSFARWLIWLDSQIE